MSKIETDGDADFTELRNCSILFDGTKQSIDLVKIRPKVDSEERFRRCLDAYRAGCLSRLRLNLHSVRLVERAIWKLTKRMS